jgi:hypothetical protein
MAMVRIGWMTWAEKPARRAGSRSGAGENVPRGTVEAPGQPGPVIHVEEARHGARYTHESALQQALRLFGLALLLVVMGAQMTTADPQRQTHKGYEMPPYQVERTDGDIEVRRYAPHIVAEVTVEGDRSTAVNRGFRVLAGYIFGGNAERRKVAMTVPVTQSPKSQDDLWTIRFMMPADFSADTLPSPDDQRIRFITTPAERQVVIRFSGLPGTAVLDRKTGVLRAWAASNGLELSSGPHFYFYDAPMTLPWNRRNEVAFTVR